MTRPLNTSGSRGGEGAAPPVDKVTHPSKVKSGSATVYKSSQYLIQMYAMFVLLDMGTDRKHLDLVLLDYVTSIQLVF